MIIDNPLKIAFHTLGCKVNYSESSYIASVFKDKGYLIVAFSDKANIYVINTCAVTQAAVKKSRHFIKKARSLNPDALVVVTGCISETEGEELEKNEGIDLIVGANQKFSLFESVENHIKNKTLAKPLIKNSDIFFSTFSVEERTRSFLKIQDGCNYFCTYCVIPYARGRSRSGYIDNIMKNVSLIKSKNINEIIITGINIGDFKNDKGERLIDLLIALEEGADSVRIRLSSIEPDLLSDEIINLFSKSKIFMPHFHIPLQSGSDRILKLMNRKYDTVFFKEKVEKIKLLLPNSCVATDVITGFPSETDEDFEQTLNFLKSIDLSYFHVFTYSDRVQTKACQISNKVSPQIKKHRTDALLSISNAKKQIFYNAQKGQQHEILFESSNIRGYMYGFTKNYIRVKMPFDKNFVNTVKIATLNTLCGDGIFVINN